MGAIATTYRPGLREDGAFVFHHPPKFMWGEPSLTGNRWGKYSLYLHVPFCRAICTFCTFERKQLRRGSIEWFLENLAEEMAIVCAEDDFAQAQVDSVYLGGGTASLLPNQAIDTFLRRLRSDFGLSDETVEVTLECEPGTKKEKDFAELRGLGVNRVSIGVQSFSDPILRSLNRRHDSQQSLRMMEDVRKAGIENLHVDLMYGLPGQAFADWKEAIDRIIGMGVDHVSTYPLIVFESQLLNRTIQKGLLPPQRDAQEYEDMRLYAVNALTSAGFERYSAIEYARPERRCRYVTATWDGSDYLGMGPGAYSRNGLSLWENTVLHTEYEDMLSASKRPVGKAAMMTPRQCLERDIAMGLCMLSVNLDELESRSGIALCDDIEEAIEKLVNDGLLERARDELRLTEDGVRYATYVMKCFTT